MFSIYPILTLIIPAPPTLSSCICSGNEFHPSRELCSPHNPDDAEVHILERTENLCNLRCHVEYLPAHEAQALPERHRPGMEQGIRRTLLNLK